MPWDRTSIRVTTEGLLAGPVYSPVVKISYDGNYLQDIKVDTPTSAGTTNTISVQRQISVDGENFADDGSAMTADTFAELPRTVFVRWAVTNTTGTPTSFVSADINLAVFSANSLSVATKEEGSDYVFGNKEILGKMESHKNNLICVGDSISNDASGSFDSFPQGLVRNARPTKWRGWIVSPNLGGGLHGCYSLVGQSNRYFNNGNLPGETTEAWAGNDSGDSSVPSALPTLNGYWPSSYSTFTSADDGAPNLLFSDGFGSAWIYAFLTGYIAAPNNAPGITATKFATKRPYVKKDGNPSFTASTNFKYRGAIITGETGAETNSDISNFAVDKFNVNSNGSTKTLLFKIQNRERNGANGTIGSLVNLDNDSRYIPWGERFNQTSDKVGMHIWESPNQFNLAATTFQSGTASDEVGRVEFYFKGPSNSGDVGYPGGTDQWPEKLAISPAAAMLFDDDIADDEGMSVSNIGDGSWKIANHAYEYGNSNVPRIAVGVPSGAPGYFGSYKDEGLQAYARFMDANRVMFALGTNDDSTIVGNVDQKFEDYKAMVTRFRRVLPGIEMIILVPYYSGLGGSANNIRAARAELFDKLKDEFGGSDDCVILDTQAWIETWITGAGWDDLSSNNPIQDGNYDTDSIHPTAAFMDAITTWIWSRVVQYAKDV